MSKLKRIKMSSYLVKQDEPMVAQVRDLPYLIDEAEFRSIQVPNNTINHPQVGAVYDLADGSTHRIRDDDFILVISEEIPQLEGHNEEDKG